MELKSRQLLRQHKQDQHGVMPLATPRSEPKTGLIENYFGWEVSTSNVKRIYITQLKSMFFPQNIQLFLYFTSEKQTYHLLAIFYVAHILITTTSVTIYLRLYRVGIITWCAFNVFATNNRGED